MRCAYRSLRVRYSSLFEEHLCDAARVAKVFEHRQAFLQKRARTRFVSQHVCCVSEVQEREGVAFRILEIPADRQRLLEGSPCPVHIVLEECCCP